MAAPPIATLCKKAKTDSDATNSIEACHVAVMLEATGSMTLNSAASSIAEAAKASVKSEMPLNILADL
jgi:hypothetical protein